MMPLIIATFIVCWFLMFIHQVQSWKNFNGIVDMKNYTFCSNMIFKFPKPLIIILFFNYRNVKMPLTVVIGQMVNYGFFIISCIDWYCNQQFSDFLREVLKWWSLGFTFGVHGIMIIDHEIYRSRHRD